MRKMECINSSNRHHSHPSNNLEFPAFGATSDFGIQQNSTFRLKSSLYRGVQKIKDKETYVAHVYDNGHSPKDARTIYLGRFDNEENAARAHDLVSLKFWGTTAQTNFPISEYDKALEAMANMSDHDVMVAVRRSSNSFSRGKSKYRGVVMHANGGKWQARKGPGKDSFLGTFETEEEAAIAFDIASIKRKGFKAITNFDIKSYIVTAILEGETKEERIENVSTIQGKPESSGVRNRRKKRSVSLRHFLGKQTDIGLSRNRDTSRESAIIPSAGSESQDGTSIPVFSETLAIGSSSSELDTSLTLGFKCSNSSAFQRYKPMEESCVSQEASHLAPSFEHCSSKLYQSYQTNLFKEQELKGLAMGFQHASSSGFKPFKKP